MNSLDHGRSDNDAFVALSEAEPPTMPAEERFRSLVARVHAVLKPKETKPVIASDRLKRTTLDRLDEVVAPPACGPLLEELDRAVASWRGTRAKRSHLMLIVMPPCDETAIVELWAKQNGHRILPAPARGALIASGTADVPDLAGEDLLVVPRLEDWVLRHRDGLRAVRALLAAMDGARRPIVVGCNSWAWAFLGKAAGADLLLPDPVTFRPFGAPRLHDWFSELAAPDGTPALRFRLPKTGEDVLARNADGGPASDYLETLAARSRGIPSVAWHLWRRSLRSRDEGVAADAAKLATDRDPGEQTLWVAALDEYVLPQAQQQTALLLLQALLIHGPLTAEHLGLVLPIVGDSSIAPVLVRAGFLTRQADAFACCAAAYPAIREGLAAAGLPMGVI